MFTKFYNDFIGLSTEKIQKCMGDPEADVENEVLNIEQESQVLFIQFNKKLTRT